MTDEYVYTEVPHSSLEKAKVYIYARAWPMVEDWIKNELMPEHIDYDELDDDINRWLEGINATRMKTPLGRIPKDDMIAIILEYEHIDLAEEVDSVIEDYELTSPDLSKVTLAKFKEWLNDNIK